MLEPFWPILEECPPESRSRFILHNSDGFSGTGFQPVFLHPGELFFDTIREAVGSRFSMDALRGAVFIDPTAGPPYFFHLGRIQIVRKAHENFDALQAEEPIEYRLVGLRQDAAGRVEESPVEHLLLLRGGPGGIPLAALSPLSLWPRLNLPPILPASKSRRHWQNAIVP